MVEKAYKFRLYPTPQQESLLRKTLGWVRLVYNKALAARTQAWYEHQERVGYKQTSAMLTNWKKQEDLDFLTCSKQYTTPIRFKTFTNCFHQLF